MSQAFSRANRFQLRDLRVDVLALPLFLGGNAGVDGQPKPASEIWDIGRKG